MPVPTIDPPKRSETPGRYKGVLEAQTPGELDQALDKLLAEENQSTELDLLRRYQQQLREAGATLESSRYQSDGVPELDMAYARLSQLHRMTSAEVVSAIQLVEGLSHGL